MQAVYNTILAYLFLAALGLLYLALPVVIAYYLYRRKFMTDRLRLLFAGVLVFNVLFVAFLVAMDLLA
jgi:hypothetical protein